uniref:Uncharacterized protein n=1 Tax=CrAss-like virus sp. ctYsL76 TaxID=2826826 RepID=A0A8S5QM03_9CAUD|nr:MAG TPA: hypothetical protein [CrAss-like virus sp. ctYsL76]
MIFSKSLDMSSTTSLLWRKYIKILKWKIT